MKARPWSYVFHASVPPRTSLDPSKVRVTYDSGTDTLLSDLWPLQSPTISCLVGRYEYVRIELESRRPVGTQVEDFTRTAASQNPRLIELAAFCNDLFRPSRSASEMLTPELKLKVVHGAVFVATRTYDRQHGIQPSRPQRPNWLESGLRSIDDGNQDLAAAPMLELQPAPPEEWVLTEFANALDSIAHHPQEERNSDFDRIFQYWSDQPGGSIKRATGLILLDFVRSDPLAQYTVRGIPGRPEEFLLRALKAS